MDAVSLKVAVFSAMFVILGCDFPRPPRAISISNPPTIRPSKPSDIQSVEEAMAVVMTVCRDDLHLPVVDPVQLFLYKNTASFASFGEGWRSLPINLDDITAFVRGNEIHINLEKTSGKKWGALIDLLAHEYGHTIDSRVRKQHTTSWFGEGFAGWVAARTLHALGWQDYSVTLERAKFELMNNRPLVPLDELAWDWRAHRQTSKGYIKTYGVAFVAVDRLISRVGFSAMVQYFESGDFSKSFQLTQQNLETDLEAFVSNPVPLDDRTVIEKPEWKAGDQWTYETKRPYDQPVSTESVVREDRFERTLSYAVRSKGRELFYSKETLERLGAIKEGLLVTQKYGPFNNSAWPLTLGKRWKNDIAWRDFDNEEQRRKYFLMRVAGIENVTVAAGTFLAARIQAYDSMTGRLTWEYWYSPAAKWLVKIRDYSKSPYMEKELAKFKIH